MDRHGRSPAFEPQNQRLVRSVALPAQLRPMRHLRISSTPRASAAPTGAAPLAGRAYTLSLIPWQVSCAVRCLDAEEEERHPEDWETYELLSSRAWSLPIR